MKDQPVGITFRETMSGPVALNQTDPEAGQQRGQQDGTTLSLHATIAIRDLDDFVADPSHAGTLTGHIDFAPFGQGLPGTRGVFNLFSPGDQPGLRLMVYELAFEHGGQPYYLAGKKLVRHDRGLDLWKDTTTLFTRLHRGADTSGSVVGAGVLSLGALELAKMMSTMRATGGGSTAAHAEALAKFGMFFLGRLWETYGKPSRG